jgi:histidine triad (HIT) family protein
MMKRSHGYVDGCAFCDVVRGQTDSFKVFQKQYTLAFLDRRPLFPGHCLLVTTTHFATLAELPDSWIKHVFADVRMLARAVEQAMNAEGTFVAINNRVSQSVAHFHVHVVPRRKGDGLKGFFWPRHPYKDREEIDRVLAALQSSLASLQKGGKGS